MKLCFSRQNRGRILLIGGLMMGVPTLAAIAGVMLLSGIWAAAVLVAYGLLFRRLVLAPLQVLDRVEFEDRSVRARRLWTRRG